MTKKQGKITHKTINYGNTVLCDFCAKDFTNSTTEGGIYFGSYATCPECAPKIEADARKYGEVGHIRARCPAGMSFADWVRDVLRDGEPGKVEITRF